MEPSFIGLALFAALYVIGWRLGSGPLFGLMLALPFGATAFVRLPALGGATPQVYTLFAIALLAATLLRRRAAGAVQAILARDRSAWVVLALIVLAIGGTIVLPRWFAGETVVFVPIQRGYVESPLRPIWRNIAQGGYFVLDALLYFAVAVLLLEKPRRALLSKAFFAWCITHTALGLIDLAAKYAGRGDVFAALRTANYATLSGHMVASFPRLTGPLPEAAAFAAMTLACLAFSFSYWRGTGSRLALCLALCDLVLLALSTSSTAYAAFPIVCAPMAWRIGRGVLRGRLSGRDLQVAVFGLAVVLIALVVYWIDPGPLHSYLHLLYTRVIEKRGSQSGVERSHFNALSIRNFLDTKGLGIGLGSSRSSSWAIAVLAQLGLPGAVLMAVLVAVLLRAMAGVRRTPENAALLAAGDSVCAGAVGEMIAATLSGGSADPGPVFFIAVAAVTSWRRHARAMNATTERF